MQNRKYFPFERNRYYFGKLLTAKDFESEQRYYNDKRRFVNRVTGSNGIAAGLGVIMADDVSIILQAGCAFDASGREIVVGQTQVIKLSTIEGYSQLATSSACLGIVYDEQPVDEVYSVMSEEGSGVQYNKIRETYKLVLLDEEVVAKIPSPLDDFVARQVIFADSEVEIAQYTPKVIPQGCDVVIRTEIRRLAAGSGDYSFTYNLETPGFKAADGKASAEVVANNLRLSFGENKFFETRLIPDAYLWGSSGSITLTMSGFAVRKNQESFTLKQKTEAQIKPVSGELAPYYIRNYYSKAMDKALGESYDERLWIAKIDLIRQNNQIIIDRISPAPFGQYYCNAQQLMDLSRLSEYFPKAGGETPAAPASHAAGTEQVRFAPSADQPDSAKLTSCGVFDFPLGLGYVPHEPIFSEEIMHGLGKGPVYVDIGLEFIRPGEKETSSEIILGDAGIFAGDAAEEDRLYNIDAAVKVLPERGTFVVGIRPNEASDLISLRIRWYAFKLTEVNQKIKPKHEGEKMIMIHPDTFVLPPKATAHISPVFINMPTEACNYKVLDAEGGSIDNNGVYTAPSKEGVYEIRVEALSDPSIYTHAFAIVSQKKREIPEMDISKIKV
ncbi:MAG TPA: hypothetical protein PLU75_05730 [Oscillospiraceae bacterium]|nr:hypothetical protein [Oscillospiraceae bacterium]HQQ88874.1 hypothetical protein [Oscillospiraceae bacterium]HRW57185.1 hypothetical protein [Oscillospiraceae bacterium]